MNPSSYTRQYKPARGLISLMKGVNFIPGTLLQTVLPAWMKLTWEPAKTVEGDLRKTKHVIVNVLCATNILANVARPVSVTHASVIITATIAETTPVPA